METGALRPDIVTVDKGFKYPQVLRANLALEQRLPGDVKLTLEGIYSKTMNNVFFENLALNNNGEKRICHPRCGSICRSFLLQDQEQLLLHREPEKYEQGLYLRFLRFIGEELRLRSGHVGILYASDVPSL